jgi:peptidoglycan-associated lipoprotein
MNTAKALICVTCMGAVLAACSTPQSVPATAPNAAPAAPAPVAMHAAQPQPVVTARPAYLDPNSAISTQRSVYFAFDNYTVTPQYTPLLDLQGKYLAAHPELTIKVEGNADERGGTEYNLALGQKRAEAVRKAMQVYGVKPAQMEAVSWGEEKPKATDHNEAAWTENRRVDLVYPAQ